MSRLTFPVFVSIFCCFLGPRDPKTIDRANELFSHFTEDLLTRSFSNIQAVLIVINQLR